VFFQPCMSLAAVWRWPASTAGPHSQTLAARATDLAAWASSWEAVAVQPHAVATPERVSPLLQGPPARRSWRFLDSCESHFCSKFAWFSWKTWQRHRLHLAAAWRRRPAAAPSAARRSGGASCQTRAREPCFCQIWRICQTTKTLPGSCRRGQLSKRGRAQHATELAQRALLPLLRTPSCAARQRASPERVGAPQVLASVGRQKIEDEGQAQESSCELWDCEKPAGAGVRSETATRSAASPVCQHCR
jgi:hypothetical protein